jgi:hypothetical protein
MNFDKIFDKDNDKYIDNFDGVDLVIVDYMDVQL